MDNVTKLVDFGVPEVRQKTWKYITDCNCESAVCHKAPAIHAQERIATFMFDANRIDSIVADRAYVFLLIAMASVEAVDGPLWLGALAKALTPDLVLDDLRELVSNGAALRDYFAV